MPHKVKLWKLNDSGEPEVCPIVNLDLESRLESWIESDISILSEDLLIIGRQVPTDFGGYIDLLCLDRQGDLVVVELKRGKTPREVTAQVLDYASWVVELSHERVTAIANEYLGEDGPLEQAFAHRFDSDPPEALNENHRLLIVGSDADARSERIVRYLSDNHGVAINVATFQLSKQDKGSEILARVFLLDPSLPPATGRSKRPPVLSMDELAAIADGEGIGDFFRSSVERLSPFFKRRTTRTSVSFTGDFKGSNRAVLNLIPGESSEESGLHFQVYLERLRQLFGLSEQKAAEILPADRQVWTYLKGQPEWSGYAGFFKTDEEVDRFVAGLEKSPS